MGLSDSLRATAVGLLALCALACADDHAHDSSHDNPDASGSTTTGAPNIILIVADDLGRGDVGFIGSDIRTPGLDRIAQEGVVLDRFMTAPVCSPTRMGLLTGRYPIRWGMQRTVVRPWETLGLPADEQTLPELLADAGYSDRAAFGKWHVGHAERQYHPLSQGFTEFYGSYNGAISYFETHSRDGERDWHRDFDSAPQDDGDYVTELVTDEALRFVAEHADDDDPFFLYLPYQAPHAPFEAPDDCIERNDHVPADRRVYAAMVTCLDDGVGALLDALDDHGIEDNTLVLFMSDNGAVGDNSPLRGGKETVFEGGIRVPAALRWPAGGLEGGRVVTDLMGYIDVLPTLLAAVDARGEPPARLDELDMLGAMRGEAQVFDRDWFSYIQVRDVHQLSVTSGLWKLLWQGEDPQSHDAKGALQLFDLSADEAEQDDVADEHSVRVDDMLERLREFRALRPAQGGLEWSGTAPDGWQPPAQWAVPP